ncbi:MAG: anti-sigma factor [Phycisphaerales bacterium]
MNNNNPINTDELSIAAMLRACADGEISPESCDRLKRYLAEHPEAGSQIDFERSLKGSCGRVLGEPSRCPDALRAKITAMAGQGAAAQESSSFNEAGMQDSAGIQASNEITKQQSFWRKSPMMSAMAAALVLAAGALIWQSSSIISKGGGLGLVQTTPVSYAERVGNFVAREHMRCCEEKAASKKLVHNDVEQAVAYFADKFEMPVVTPAGFETPDADASGITFYGGGDCHVPSTSGSGHMRFDAIGPDGDPISLSLFVSPDPGLLELEEGVTYKLDSTQCSEQGANLFAWVTDGVLYLLVSEADQNMCATVRGMMNAPTELRSL